MSTTMPNRCPAPSQHRALAALPRQHVLDAADAVEDAAGTAPAARTAVSGGSTAAHHAAATGCALVHGFLQDHGWSGNNVVHPAARCRAPQSTRLGLHAELRNSCPRAHLAGVDAAGAGVARVSPAASACNIWQWRESQPDATLARWRCSEACTAVTAAVSVQKTSHHHNVPHSPHLLHRRRPSLR